MSLVWKIAILVLTIVFVTSCFVGFNSTIKNRQNTIESMQHVVETIAQMGNVVIPKDAVLDIISGEQTWDEVNNILADIVSRTDCMYAYLLYKDGNNFVYIADGSEEQEDFWSNCEYDVDILHEVWNGEDYISPDFEFYEEDEIYVITAYSKILDDSGNTIAVLGIDLDATQYKQSVKQGWFWIAAVIAVAMVVANIISILFSKKLNKNLTTLTQKVVEISEANGDLTQELSITSGDELEVLSNALNALFQYIRQVITAVKDNTVSLDGSTTHLGQLVNRQNEEVSSTAAIMEEMSASSEEISASLTQVTESVVDASAKSDALFEESVNKQGLASEIITRVKKEEDAILTQKQQVLTSTELTSREMRDCVEKSKAVYRIEELTNAILEIADQTNLLALNASIEAARAGDAGRGFAVVAGEIQNLAENCSTTATDIQKVTKEVISSVDKLIEDSTNMIQLMNDTTHDAYQNLSNLSKTYVTDASEFYQTFEQITDSMKQFKENMDSITAAVQSVSVAVNENTTGVSEIAETMSSMQSDIEDIMKVMTTNQNIVSNVTSELKKFII